MKASEVTNLPPEQRQSLEHDADGSLDEARHLQLLVAGVVLVLVLILLPVDFVGLARPKDDFSVARC